MLVCCSILLTACNFGSDSGDDAGGVLLYVKIGSAIGPAGAGADSAGRNQSIAIGYNATATNWTSVAIGSGGNYALAAARALAQNTDLPAKEIAYKALRIAGDICVFTNDHVTVLEV